MGADPGRPPRSVGRRPAHLRLRPCTHRPARRALPGARARSAPLDDSGRAAGRAGRAVGRRARPRREGAPGRARPGRRHRAARLDRRAAPRRPRGGTTRPGTSPRPRCATAPSRRATSSTRAGRDGQLMRPLQRRLGVPRGDVVLGGHPLAALGVGGQLREPGRAQVSVLPCGGRRLVGGGELVGDVGRGPRLFLGQRGGHLVAGPGAHPIAGLNTLAIEEFFGVFDRFAASTSRRSSSRRGGVPRSGRRCTAGDAYGCPRRPARPGSGPRTTQRRPLSQRQFEPG